MKQHVYYNKIRLKGYLLSVIQGVAGTTFKTCSLPHRLLFMLICFSLLSYYFIFVKNSLFASDSVYAKFVG